MATKKVKELKARDWFQVWAWKRYANAAWKQGNKRKEASRKACRGRVKHD